MTSSLPPNKRYIATHDANGKSVYAPSPDQVYRSAGNAGSIARSYSVANIPVEMGHEEDIKAYLAGPESVSSFQRPEIVVPTEGGKNFGSNLMVIDLKPGGYSGLHRTVSIDYSICVIGTIIHELDSGERVTLKPGDHIVQRGTNHRWINGSETEPARFVAVTLPCVPFDIAGKQLEEVHTPDESGYKPKL
ncbi:hypothetical protein H2198_005150 [Neophaeococcomyces mojaviensis]|uniref:Uncharacterized protein n=1 Tax=Neophaeococcomyces mojaviensis TaxID=3383035 RepID=A0ACC3A6K4_9EURO|nr:hypothetical protein H2198_005150 [Knufia sp. JES_112]